MHSLGKRLTTPLGVVSLAVVALVLVTEIWLPGTLFSVQTLGSVTPLVGTLVLVAAGQALVIGTGGIDLSVPATVTLVGVVVLNVTQGQSGRLGALAVAVLATCAAVGMVNGVFVEVFGLNALVVTLAVGQLVAGATRLYRGPVQTVTEVPAALSAWSRSDIGGVSFLLLIAFAVVVGATLVLRQTVWGRRLVASSASGDAAVLVGIRAVRYRVLTYIVASCLYGVAGVVLAGLIRTPDLTLGSPYLLAPIVAVVIGGAALTGGRVSLVATMMGAVFVSVLDHKLQVAGIPSGASLIAQGLIIGLGLTLVGLLQRSDQPLAGLRRWLPWRASGPAEGHAT